VEINCAVSYLPFEGRIDRVTFELLLHKAQPKELIMINSASSKIKHVQLYCAANNVNTHVQQASDSSKPIRFNSQAALK
jgi:hypothetical protein